MFEAIPILNAAGLMARHAAARQSVISENIANADTPNYKARDISSFHDEVRSMTSGFQGLGMNLRYAASDFESSAVEEAGGSTSSKPNGNTVSIEGEMLKSIEAERQHSRALAIYQHSIDILKMSIGRG